MPSASNSNVHDSCHPFRILRAIEVDSESASVEDFQVTLTRPDPDAIVLMTNLQIPAVLLTISDVWEPMSKCDPVLANEDNVVEQCRVSRLNSRFPSTTP